MEDNKKKTTTDKKKSTTTRGKKKAEKPVETELPQAQVDMNQMFQMFQQFMMTQMNQVQPITTEIQKEKKKASAVKKNKSYLRKERGDEDVLVRSVAGTVCFKSPKTGVTYNFMENGDEEWLTVDEILQMETASKKYLHEPWLIVEDDEINEILGISKVVDGVEKLNNIDVPIFMRWGNDKEMILEEADELVQKLRNNINNPKKNIDYIDGADHGYKGKEEILAKQIVEFIKNIKR